MIIPNHYRKQLKSAGHPRWVWKRIWDWAFGKRYRFRDGSVAYIYDNEIVTIRHGDKVLWRKEM